MCNERQITKNFSDLATPFKQLITSINIYHFYTYILLAYQLLLHAFTSTCNYNYDIALTVNSIIKKTRRNKDTNERFNNVIRLD